MLDKDIQIGMHILPPSRTLTRCDLNRTDLIWMSGFSHYSRPLAEVLPPLQAPALGSEGLLNFGPSWVSFSEPLVKRLRGKRAWLRSSSRRGFSLVELLVVLGIMAVLTALAVPAVSALQGAGNLTGATTDIASTLESARAYAMGNNTYVYVGLQEVSETSPTAASGTGRLVVVTIASKDGTRPTFSQWGTSALSTSIVSIDKPEAFKNIHLATAASLINGTNMTSRPSGSLVTDLGATGTVATTTFQWPLSGTAQNIFTKVIEFDPQGVARIQTGDSYDSSVSNYIEVPLLPTHGTQVPTAPAQIANQAAIQVDGVTGAVRIYRP